MALWYLCRTIDVTFVYKGLPRVVEPDGGSDATAVATRSPLSFAMACSA